MPLVGMLAFSTVFALPFFVLALAPQLVSQLPRAGGWMNSVKVAMGFLEVAAAMKFISNVDLIWKWGIFTRDVVLSIWIAIGDNSGHLSSRQIPALARFETGKDRRFSDVCGDFESGGQFLSFDRTLRSKLGELESFLPPDLNNSSADVSAKAKKSDLDQERFAGARPGEG